jgi:hypothetical protein
MSEATHWMELLLRKKDMDQRAAQVDEAQNAPQTRQLFQAAGGAAEAIGGAMKQAKLDNIANSLMNEDKPPTATAVDPAIQKQVMADRKAAGLGGPVSPATGGLAEMKLTMAMDEWKQKQIDSLLRREQAEQAMKLRQQNADSLDAYRAGQLDLRPRQPLPTGGQPSMPGYSLTRQAAPGATDGTMATNERGEQVILKGGQWVPVQ